MEKSNTGDTKKYFIFFKIRKSIIHSNSGSPTTELIKNRKSFSRQNKNQTNKIKFENYTSNTSINDKVKNIGHKNSGLKSFNKFNTVNFDDSLK